MRQHAVPQVAVEGPANGSQGTFWFPGPLLYVFNLAD
jgi:hypothetical protein